jgi:hypothetical protein
VVILAYFAIPYSLTSFSFLTHTQSISWHFDIIFCLTSCKSTC